MFSPCVLGVDGAMFRVHPACLRLPGCGERLSPTTAARQSAGERWLCLWFSWRVECGLEKKSCRRLACSYARSARRARSVVLGGRAPTLPPPGTLPCEDMLCFSVLIDDFHAQGSLRLQTRIDVSHAALSAGSQPHGSDAQAATARTQQLHLQKHQRQVRTNQDHLEPKPCALPCCLHTTRG